MTKGARNIIKVVCVVAAAAVLAVFMQPSVRKVMEEAASSPVVCDTTTVTLYDTVTVYRPVPRDSVVLRYDTVRLPVAIPQSRNNIPLKSNTGGNVIPEIIPQSQDSAEVVLPISQIEARDSLCHIWASGYRVSIDSLRIYPKTEYITITRHTKPKRWHVGLSAGYGWTPQGAQPFVGASLTYSIFSF